jgi:hypothetical protein
MKLSIGASSPETEKNIDFIIIKLLLKSKNVPPGSGTFSYTKGMINNERFYSLNY